MKDMEIKLSQASWRDFSQVMNVEKKCFPLDVWPMLDILGVLSFPWYTKIKAEEGEKLVGFIAGEIKKNTEGWISTIGVLPEFQKLGIGKQLLEACEKELNMPNIKLSVRESNHSAISFYNGLGYMTVGKWKKYYKGGEDGTIMQKQIR
jgi:ribosomal protein S18 acetylase RimI-like enzyme